MFGLFDSRTGARVAACSWIRAERAEEAIEGFRARCLRGGRPDISLETIDAIVVLPLPSVRNP